MPVSNPIVSQGARIGFDADTRRFIEAWEAAWVPLLAAADALREHGRHDQAEVLETEADRLQTQFEHVLEELEEGGDLDVRGQAGDEIVPSLEELLAHYWDDHLRWRQGQWHDVADDVHADPAQLAAFLRGVIIEYATWAEVESFTGTDEQILTAAADAWERREGLKR